MPGLQLPGLLARRLGAYAVRGSHRTVQVSTRCPPAPGSCVLTNTPLSTQSSLGTETRGPPTCSIRQRGHQQRQSWTEPQEHQGHLSLHKRVSADTFLSSGPTGCVAGCSRLTGGPRRHGVGEAVLLSLMVPQLTLRKGEQDSKPSVSALAPWLGGRRWCSRLPESGTRNTLPTVYNPTCHVAHPHTNDS